MKSIIICVLAFSAVASADFGKVIAPLVKNIAPLAYGTGRGLSLAASHVNKGLRNVGNAVGAAVNGAASVAADAANGLGETVEGIPETTYQIISAISHNKGVTADIKPFLQDITPLNNAVAKGIVTGENVIRNVAKNVGSAANEIAEGLGDAAQGIAVGLGNTIKNAPEAWYQTLVSVARDNGLIGKIDRYF